MIETNRKLHANYSQPRNEISFGCLFDLRPSVSKVFRKRVSCFRSINFTLLFRRELFVGYSYFNSLTLKGQALFTCWSLAQYQNGSIKSILNKDLCVKEMHVTCARFFSILFCTITSYQSRLIKMIIFLRDDINFSYEKKKKTVNKYYNFDINVRFSYNSKLSV